ncbi:MAG: TIGR00282 family metallophosphoesterase [Proteobacteria bacterium]|nr:TIGR00282 family metallophosphoesterase [Pseudomonadota bacterium]
MRILFLGDIFGRSGRDVVAKYLPLLKQKLTPHVVIANIENAAHGFGITPKIADDLFALGIDVMTSGNHIWDQKDIMPYADRKEHFLRPYNFPPKTPGKGLTLFKISTGQNILVINLMGRTFMDPLDDPFQSIDHILSIYRLKGNNIGAIFLDFHAEATSEKMAMAHYLDGRISCVIGTHTHAPTADAQILDKGTSIQTDAGMCGDYNSVIGVKPLSPVFKFTRKLPSEKFSPTDGLGTLCGVFIETDDQSGLSKKINPIRLGPRLLETPLDF